MSPVDSRCRIVAVANTAAERIESALRREGDPERAAGAKRYLKSELEFVGLRAPQLRTVLATVVSEQPPFDRDGLLAVVAALWARPVYELRAAAVELLTRHVALLEPLDLAVVERLIRESRTWALVDGLAPHVAGPMLERFPALAVEVDRWARDDDFWLRRAALLVHLLPLRRGDGDFQRFAGHADSMLEDREFCIRKAIGWVLRETSKKRPELVADWLAPRAHRAAGLTIREAVKYLPPDLRAKIVHRTVTPSTARH